jgi:vanillate O-demethylase monooxygenase subunit
MDNAELSKLLHDTNYTVFQQDLAMLESQQRRIEESSDVRLATLNIDAGGKRARMIMEKLIAEEETGDRK